MTLLAQPIFQKKNELKLYVKMLLNNVPNYYNFIEIDDYDKKNTMFHII